VQLVHKQVTIFGAARLAAGARGLAVARIHTVPSFILLIALPNL